MTGTTGEARKLWALDGATFTLDSGLLVVGGQGEVTVPVPSFLIEHPRGLVLFDTGIVPDAVDDPRAVYGALADEIQMDFTAEQRVDSQVRALGYRTEDVTHVVVSHSHFDHTGGVPLFPNSDFYIGRGDLPYAYWPMPAAEVFFHTAELDAARDYKWNQVDGDHDLFGDGAITLLEMPGHTPGNKALLVRLPNRTVLLTGDTVHLRQAVEEDLPMPSDYSTLQSVWSIRRLQQLAKAHDAMVWIAHDPQDWAAYQHAPSHYD
jgi:glyoxylase-like metal-dependent hydrolase (beta-lactamase superfamily II)